MLCHQEDCVQNVQSPSYNRSNYGRYFYNALIVLYPFILVSTPIDLYIASKHYERYANPGLQVVDHSNQTVNSTHSIMSQHPQQSHGNPQAPSQQPQHKVCNSLDNRSRKASSSFNTAPSQAPLNVTPGINPSSLSISHSSVPIYSLASQSSAPFATNQQSNSSVYRPTSSLEVLQYHYPELLRLLPMEDNFFIAELFKRKLLPHNLKAVIDSLSTRADKVTKFLDSVITPSTENLNNVNFNELLQVMMTSNDNAVKQLAKEIIFMLNQNCFQSEKGMYVVSYCQSIFTAHIYVV